MNKFLSSLIVITSLTACSTSIPITTANGKLGHAINCSGGNMIHCYEKASEKCGAKGYTILDQNDRSAGLFTGADKRMIVECK
ncbi:hypothetical protein H5125_21100 [Shewanella sp. SR44-4]|uniref:hypothetical protein n=1 Tax=Shewanella sp. SR44-4 TaxID=2760935 RepID=UPI0015FEBBA0|nr:hypothetical protein [Shewanella sp. SR44-4]MBB1364644.1 hypothetical protein [Shewanella sp. SR44-4]